MLYPKARPDAVAAFDTLECLWERSRSSARSPREIPFMERRSGSRIRCHLVCQLRLDEGPRTAAIVDLSRGGMRLLSDQPIDQGESLRVRFAARGGKPVEVDVLVWHARRLARNKFSIGLVLSEPSQDYFDAVEALGAERPASGAPDPPPPAGSRRQAGRPSPFSVRARQRGSPRTRTLYVEASSPEAARERALRALGDGWSLLEVVKA
jgi:hypothetical protein